MWNFTDMLVRRSAEIEREAKTVPKTLGQMLKSLNLQGGLTKPVSH